MHQIVHVQDLLIAQALPAGQHLAAFVVCDRAGERVQPAGARASSAYASAQTRGAAASRSLPVASSMEEGGLQLASASAAMHNSSGRTGRKNIPAHLLR